MTKTSQKNPKRGQYPSNPRFNIDAAPFLLAGGFRAYSFSPPDSC
ncbi:hypothetical protein A176_005485 [Myxococcus hansupus]|uniref:Uncharacterized protein n=1 Tax=Pseudomyxococcus hansupus TaxID=1297742 RepID=A0A0H4X3X8_9BACT|nr:hypothetical protein [Myxococcus hansupus]AKQ68573.1 hypothetical protein A176_005485 [Myxococcus hansupus]